jgi:hypothetical protein
MGGEMPYVETRGGNIRVKWWALEYTESGKKKYESASGPESGVPFKDEDEAYNFGLDREYDVRHGKHISRIDSKTLMEEYCWQWHAAQDLRPMSMVRYKSRLRARIIPYWGTRAVGDITAWEYEAWKKSLKAAVAKGELSENYVDSLLGLFGIVMGDAVTKYKLRAESPVIVQRRRGKYQKKKREKKRPMQMAVLHQLACNAYAVWGYTGWVYMWTIPFTGMRPPGEMWGLRREYASPTWPASDPDPERRKESLERYTEMPALRVQWQHQYVDGKRTLVEPKYESHRTLVLPPFLHQMHSALLASHRSPWVFPALDGSQMGTQWHMAYWRYIRDGSPERVLRKDFIRPEIPPVPEMTGKRIYLLRHWMKEMLEEDGHSRTAQETRMGHEVAGVEGLYANLTPGMERSIAASLQERWETFWSTGPWWMPPFPNPLPLEGEDEG